MCRLTGGFIDCNYTAGALKRILLVNYYQQSTPPRLTGGTVDITPREVGKVAAPTTVSSYQLDADGKVIKLYFLAGTYVFETDFDPHSATFDNNITPLDSNEGVSEKLLFSFSVAQMETAKRKILEQLIRSKITALVQDYNEHWWILGLDNGLRVNALQNTTDQYAGFNGSHPSWQGQEQFLTREITAAAVEAFLTVPKLVVVKPILVLGGVGIVTPILAYDRYTVAELS